MVTRLIADKLSSKKPKLKYESFSDSQLIISLLIIRPEEVMYKRQIEYNVQIPVEINVKLIVKCFDLKDGMVEFSVIKNATHIGKNIIMKTFEKIKSEKFISYPFNLSAVLYFLLKLIINDIKIVK